jgi:XTP/dITP diphosphohydrolase
LKIDLYLASGNAHKVLEFQALAKAAGGGIAESLTIHSAKEAGGMPAVVEDTGTFEGNAGKKARALLERLPEGAWALSDDSGVCVDHLAGGPGVESAYFAGPQADSIANLHKLVETMRGVPAQQRAAHFVCVLCLARRGHKELYFHGNCHGRLLDEPRGKQGFGYDPLFVPEGYDRSYAELGEQEKNRFSHRSRAWAALCDWLRAELG